MIRTLILLLAFMPLAVNAQLTLRQATASQTVVLGPFVDSTDAVSPETGLTIDAADVRISVNGGNIVGKNSGGCTHDELGMYACTFDATDTATVGRFQVTIAESGALVVSKDFVVVEEAVFDACCAASAAPLTASAVWANGTRTLTALDEDDTTLDFDGTYIGGIFGTINTLDGLDTAQDTQHSATQSAVATVDTEVGVIDGIVDSILVDTAVIGAAGAGLTAVPWNAAWDAQVESEVDDALGGGTGTALTAIPWNASWDAEVQSEVNDGLVAIHLDHAFAVDYDPASKPGAATALFNELIESDGGVSRFTINALEQGPSGSGASAASIADAVWEEAIADHSGTVGSTAEALDGASAGGGLDAAGVRAAVGLASANLDTQLGTIDSEIGTIDGVVDAILVDTGTTLQAEVDGIQADTENLQSRIPTALVGGRIDATVDATGMEAGAVTAIQSGLATAAALTTVDNEIATIDGIVDSILVDTAEIGTAGAGLTEAGGTGDHLSAIPRTPVASYTNADGDVCLFIISETAPHITLDCTEAP